MLALTLIGCAGAPRAAEPARQPNDDAISAVRAIHGGAGPWAVAGYRMGSYALAQLGLPRGSFDLLVVHHTPREVQYSCVADGAAAATGASLGKLNLSLSEATPLETRTTYQNRVTGQKLTLRVTAAFRERFANVPRSELGAAGRVVAQAPDSEIFETVPTAP